MSVGIFKNGKYVKVAGLAQETPIFTPATETENGESGLVPAPTKGNESRFLCSNGEWNEIDSILVADIEKLFN